MNTAEEINTRRTAIKKLGFTLPAIGALVAGALLSGCTPTRNTARRTSRRTSRRVTRRND